MTTFKCNPIKEDTDLSKLKRYSWDVVLEGEEYYVYRLEGYVHTFGGHYHCNDLYCCRRTEEPSYKTLLRFDAEPIRYGVISKHNNYVNDRDYVCDSYNFTIIRNDVEIFNFNSSSLELGMAQSQVFIDKIKDHPINFIDIDYHTRVLGRLIKYMGEPAYIGHFYPKTSYMVIMPDINAGADISKFNDEFVGNKNVARADIFSKNIDWWRD